MDNIALNANIIYHDENIRDDNEEIYYDCRKIQKDTKGTVILSNNLFSLDIILANILNSNSNSNCKCKFVLIVNGKSAQNTVSFIKRNNYNSLFINSCIYTKDKKANQKIQEENADFYGKIVLRYKELFDFIKESFINYKGKNEKLKIDALINLDSYKNEYFILHKLLADSYGDNSQKKYKIKFPIIEDLIKNDKLGLKLNDIKEELIDGFKTFSSLEGKNYEKIISYYLANNNFSIFLKKLMNKKDKSIFEKIGYFAGNLMYSIVEYGKKYYKAIDRGKTFYKGIILNIFNLLEFLKNKNSLITFPYFFSMTTEKNLANISSKRYSSELVEKNNKLYSVIIQIDYLYDDGYEPCIYNLTQLSNYPDEEDYILLPFTFLGIKKVKIDSEKFIADIEMEVIGKLEILENKIKNSLKILEYDEKANIMYAKQIIKKNN